MDEYVKNPLLRFNPRGKTNIAKNPMYAITGEEMLLLGKGRRDSIVVPNKIKYAPRPPIDEKIMKKYTILPRLVPKMEYDSDTKVWFRFSVNRVTV